MSTSMTLNDLKPPKPNPLNPNLF